MQRKRRKMIDYFMDTCILSIFYDLAKGMALKFCARSYTFIKMIFWQQSELSYMVVKLELLRQKRKVIQQFSLAYKEMLLTNYNVVVR